MDYIPKYPIGAKVIAKLPDRLTIQTLYDKDFRAIGVKDVYIPTALRGPAIISAHRNWGDYGFEYGFSFEGENLIRWVTPKEISDRP